MSANQKIPNRKNESAFDSLYEKLNSAQKEAVDAVEGPVMVIAGPGTGKTTILTLRIANILKQTDTPPHGILAITYTNSGVKSIRNKLYEIIGNRAYEVPIHTFHSFASAMIAEYHDHFLRLDGLRNMTDVEQESLIRSIITQSKYADLRPMGKPYAYIPAIMSDIDAAKREDLKPDKVREHTMNEIERIKKDEDSISTRGASEGKLKAEAQEFIEKCERTILFADVYAEYEKKKFENKCLDFNDLINELLKALRGDELFLRLIQERFLYVMVDEHQDTNDSQNRIIELLADFFDTPNIFIVGDEKQAIYRFQGASVENFLNFKNLWKDMKEIRLDLNYRSHQSILDAGFAMIENNYAGDEHRNLRVKLKSGLKEKARPIDIVIGETVPTIEKYLVDELRSLAENEPQATVAIITRRNRDLERVIRLLEANSIPVSSERSVDIFHHPIGAVFFDLIEFLVDFSRTDALGKTLAAGLWNIPFEESAQMIKALRSGKNAELEKKIPTILHLQRKMLNDGAIGFLIHVAEESGFTSLLARDPAYVHVWRGIVALAESLTREGNIVNPSELIKAMLAYRLSAESKTVKVSVGAPDLPVKSMTAHGSKGLEFDYVFMPYAHEESWIGRSRGSSFVLPKKKVEDSERDIRRLFYVALTRARKHAVILSALAESDGKELSLLRFIAELDRKSVKETLLSRAEVELSATSTTGAAPLSRGSSPDFAEAISGGKRREKPPAAIKGAGLFTKDPLVNLAKEVLLDKGLSVTALNHFMKCPNEFLYQSILKLPQAPSPSAEKGTAMHEAISRAWNEKDQSAGHIQEIMTKAIVEYLEGSFLATSEKEAVKKELFKNLPAVVKALASHFNAKGRIFTERWVEAVFESSYDGNRIALPIHGKLDAILESDSTAEVYDYKTRRAMSVAAIKGKTKSSTGDYWRQLIFYKLLMKNDPRWKFRAVNPSLVFVSPDEKGRCPIISVPINDADIARVKNEIQSLIESVWSGRIAAAKCEDHECEWCGMRGISK